MRPNPAASSVMSLSVAAPVFAIRSFIAAFSFASCSASAAFRALLAAAAASRPPPSMTVPSAITRTSSVTSLSVAALVFFSFAFIAAFSALMRAASSAFFFFFASKSSLRRRFMSSSRDLASPPPVAASFAFISLFSLRRFSASCAFRIADSLAAFSRAACVDPSRPSSVRGFALGLTGRTLPAASSLAAL